MFGVHVRRLVTSDLDTVSQFLWPKRVECMFMCSNLSKSGIEFKPEAFHGEYWGVFADGACKGVLSHY